MEENGTLDLVDVVKVRLEAAGVRDVFTYLPDTRRHAEFCAIRTGVPGGEDGYFDLAFDTAVRLSLFFARRVELGLVEVDAGDVQVGETPQQDLGLRTDAAAHFQQAFRGGQVDVVEHGGLGHARLAAQAGAAVVVVLHDLSLAAAYADEVVVLADGKLRGHGHPREVFTSELLTAVYRHPIEVLTHPTTGALMVMPVRVPAQP